MGVLADYLPCAAGLNDAFDKGLVRNGLAAADSDTLIAPGELFGGSDGLGEAR